MFKNILTIKWTYGFFTLMKRLRTCFILLHIGSPLTETHKRLVISEKCVLTGLLFQKQMYLKYKESFN